MFCPKKRTSDIERTSHKENHQVGKEDSLCYVWFGLVLGGQIDIRFGMVQAVCKLDVDTVEDSVEIGKTKEEEKEEEKHYHP